MRNYFGEEKQLTWFELMWRNKGYIVGFVFALIAAIVEIVYWEDLMKSMFDEFEGIFFTSLGIIIPWAVMIIIAYKGFYQHWQDYKNGITR